MKNIVTTLCLRQFDHVLNRPEELTHISLKPVIDGIKSEDDRNLGRQSGKILKAQPNDMSLDGRKRSGFIYFQEI